MKTKVTKEKSEPTPEVGTMYKAREEKKVEVIVSTVAAMEDKQISVKSIIDRLNERRAALKKLESDCVYDADWYYAAKWKTATDEIDKTIYELIRYLEK
jgi:hypothetical protein